MNTHSELLLQYFWTYFLHSHYLQYTHIFHSDFDLLRQTEDTTDIL